ncbi:MAG: hypothetical protein VB042_08045 [Victivallaceae bacterium]|nr:hypothetical protein [Victivallaceae bacterium]
MNIPEEPRLLHRISRIAMALLLAAAVAGCEGIDKLINGEADEKISRDETLKPSEWGVISGIRDQNPVSAKKPDMSAGGDVNTNLVVEPLRTDTLISEDNLPKSGVETPARVEDTGSAAFATVFAGRPGDEKMRVDIDADNLNIVSIIARFASDMKFNYTIESGVTGSVSMSLHTDMTLSESWELFNQLLWMCGAYCDFQDNVLYIRPLAAVSRDRRVMDQNGGVAMRAVRMKYVAAASIIEQIKPFLSNDATARVLTQNNSILLIDTPENINRALEIINELDKSYKQGWYRVVIPCNQISSTKVLSELKQIMPVLGFSVTDVGNVDSSPGAIHVISLDRLQVLVASASAIEPLVELRNWVNVLNRADAEERMNAYVYKVKHGDASKLLTELSVLFPKMVGIVIQAKSASISTVNGVASANTDPNQPATSVFDYPVRMAANMEYNRMLIQTTPRVWGIIKALLERLDSVPPQVLLQVMVVQIELSDSNSFGLEWNAQTTINGEDLSFGTDYSDLNPGAVNQYGGLLHLTDPDNPTDQFLYVKALAGKTKLTVLSSPQVLVRSQYKAVVSVGKEVPTLRADIASIDSTTAVTTSVSRAYVYKDTGVILEVTPTISEGGLISLDVSQTISDVLSTTSSGLETPTFKNDQLSTNLSLRSGNTIVMGGMIRNRNEDSLSSIPVIAEIPMLNWLVGDSSRKSERTEILMLITATIIDESTSLEDMVRRYSDSLREINVFENEVYAPYQKEHDKAEASGLLTPRDQASDSIASDQENMRMLVSAMQETPESERVNPAQPPAASEQPPAPAAQVPENK